jgi:ribose transport system substrate-binding protein
VHGEDSVTKWAWVATAVLVALAAHATAAAQGAEAPPRIVALAVAPVANAWRAAMLESWQRTTDAAARAGEIAAAPVRSATANTLQAEAAQLTALITEHPAAIVVDAGSPEALNGVVRRACDAGIVVVSFDGIVTEPCAYRLQYDFGKLGAIEVDYLARKLGAGGNLLELRGVSNTDLDEAIHDGVAAALGAHPQLHVVGAVHGNWRRGDAKRNTGSVLPVLPEIAGVVVQGGDALGVADAFTAAGRPMPTIILGNRAEELAWWKARRDADGYQTLSIAPSPGIASLAFWIAQMILDGVDVPHDVTAPFLTVEAGDLDQALATAPAGGTYSRDFTRTEANEVVAASRR